MLMCETVGPCYRPVVLARKLRESRACNLIREIIRIPAGSNLFVKCFHRSPQSIVLLVSLVPLLPSLHILITAIRSFRLAQLPISDVGGLILIAREARRTRPRHLVCKADIPDYSRRHRRLAIVIFRCCCVSRRYRSQRCSRMLAPSRCVACGCSVEALWVPVVSLRR